MALDSTATVTPRLAARVRELRAARQLSLEALATASDVSRSMLSLIERGETSPTAVILEKLAAGLGVTLASLFDAPTTDDATARGPLSRRADQGEWEDPGSGYRRRNVSPGDALAPVQIVDVHFPAGARVAFDIGTRDARVTQQVWMLDGVMEVTSGTTRHRLSAGDCVAMRLDQPTAFHNPTRKPARYAVILHTDHGARR